MSSRIEIELTSKRNESEWTWRAAGAKQPKGTLDSSVLYPDAKVGDVVRAEADFEIDGITIVSVLPPQSKRAESKQRIEVKGSSREFKPVTSQLASKPKGERRDRKSRGPRGENETERERRGPRPDRGARRERPERPARPQAPQYKRLAPKDDHRKVVLDSLSPEQRPIAEQVLRGGIPAVRQAIEAENEKAKADGRLEVNAAGLIAIAEELLPRLKTAEWMDRAEAAKTQMNEISVRDLRAVVTGADAVARTDEARLLASELRVALEQRTKEERERWTKDITTCLDENRVVRALRLSARPPDAQTKFPPELLERLKQAAEQAMAPDTTADRWLMLLEAVSASPVRRNVEPVGLPAEPGDELLAAAKAAGARIPALAKQLGVTMPPPPPPRKVPPKPSAPTSSVATSDSTVSSSGNEGERPDTQDAASSADVAEPESASEGTSVG